MCGFGSPSPSNSSRPSQPVVARPCHLPLRQSACPVPPVIAIKRLGHGRQHGEAQARRSRLQHLRGCGRGPVLHVAQLLKNTRVAMHRLTHALTALQRATHRGSTTTQQRRRRRTRKTRRRRRRSTKRWVWAREGFCRGTAAASGAVPPPPTERRAACHHHCLCLPCSTRRSTVRTRTGTGSRSGC